MDAAGQRPDKLDQARVIEIDKLVVSSIPLETPFQELRFVE